MFTGIIEETGTITVVKKLQNGALLTVGCDKVLDGTKIGDSIAINGACQTVTELNNGDFVVFVSYETLSLTTLGSLQAGNKVNLERALRLSDRLGGHIVSGHVDGTGIFVSSKIMGEGYKITFSLLNDLLKQVVKKGSITVDGVSLTVAEVTETTFSTAVIPHTYKNTLMKDLKPDSRVNIETDILGKYVEKLLLSGDNNSRKTINENFLERNGFL